MDQQFKVDEVLTIDDLRAAHAMSVVGMFGRSIVRAGESAHKLTNSFFGTSLIVMAVIMFLFILFLPEAKEIWLPLTLMAAAALFFGVRTFRQRKTSLASELFPNVDFSDTPMQISFEDDAFFVSVGGNSSSYRYHALTDISEDEARFYLLFPGRVYLILQKAAFVVGRPEDFTDFLAQKTGKVVKCFK